MAIYTGILSLGTRQDATTWQTGCRNLGIGVSISPIATPNPSMTALKDFFMSSSNWLFIASHFASTLYNDAHNVDVQFFDVGVDVTVQRELAQLRKSACTFSLHESCSLILWGGCSVLGSATHVRTMRRLFNQPLLLGFAGLTGWRIVNAMLGAGFIPANKAFFSRINTPGDSAQVRDAWMNTALCGYGGNASIEHLFRAVDPDGQEWKLSGKTIVRGVQY